MIDQDLVRRALRRESPFRGRPPRGDTPPLPAAVCVPIAFAPEPIAYAVLRSDELRDHAGEVGFPGGKVEEGDRDLCATALRELGEEVAVHDVDVLGPLTPVPVITGRYLIHPFVGDIGASRPTIRSGEIAALLPIPLAPYLRGEAPVEAVESTFAGQLITSPHFRLPLGDDSVVLYGASAYMLWELLLRVAGELEVTMPAPTLVEQFPWGDRYG